MTALTLGARVRIHAGQYVPRSVIGAHGTVAEELATNWRGQHFTYYQVDVDGQGRWAFEAHELQALDPAGEVVPAPAPPAGTTELPPGLQHTLDKAAERSRVAEETAEAAVAFMHAFTSRGFDYVLIADLNAAAQRWEAVR
ncbi:hypothetical protein DNL40_02545 [Xylanimonas oleitrophica]|uniref:Uncharacterized protein n=1 Tax=Xylanimonas oleitrophica TaxID=2607479 RepID=A0A2W5WUX1_9MICO|nr:hypothetical protein [Xylanimonas oleitrophica]PZR55269.1 hypothetical protein DNL40_02545 [Xylanimonas oleitrophica]